MKKILIYLTINALVGFTALYAQTSETRRFGGFDKLKLEGAAEIILIQGNQESALIEMQNLNSEEVITEVKNQTLLISQENSRKDRRNTRLKITLTFKQLKEIKVEGASSITTQNILKTADLKINIQGAGSLNLQVDTQKIDIYSAGAGSLQISGKTNYEQIVLAGAGSINALKLEAERSNVELNGVGNLSVFAKKELVAELNGVGSLTYKGNPPTKQVSKNGIGSIKQVN
jgi:hypothetical protein